MLVYVPFFKVIVVAIDIFEILSLTSDILKAALKLMRLHMNTDYQEIMYLLLSFRCNHNYN